MQRFRVECNFGSKYFDDIFNARRYFYTLMHDFDEWIIEKMKSTKGKNEELK